MSVTCTTNDGVAVVTLDDAEHRNALGAEIVAGIVTTFDALEGDDEVGAVVVTGAPPAFCAGADLSQLGDARDEGLRAVYEEYHPAKNA